MKKRTHRDFHDDRQTTEVGKRIVAHMQSLGVMTIGEYADRSGVNVTRLYRAIYGITTPDPDFYDRLGAFMQVSGSALQNLDRPGEFVKDISSKARILAERFDVFPDNYQRLIVAFFDSIEDNVKKHQ